LHNKPKAAVLAGAFMLMGPREEEEEEENSAITHTAHESNDCV
jgi:hypothetical protein